MAYTKTITCATRGCPHSFEVSVSRWGRDEETGRCPTCYNETRMVFEGGSLDFKQVI